MFTPAEQPEAEELTQTLTESGEVSEDGEITITTDEPVGMNDSLTQALADKEEKKSKTITKK